MQKCLLFLLLFAGKTLFSQVNDKLMVENEKVSQPPIEPDKTRNEDKQIHSLLNSSDQKVYLLNPAVVNSHIKWELQVEHSRSPSSHDQARIYLLADKDDFRASLNGYFIQIEEDDAGHSYHLYRQHGSSVTKIITGTRRSFSGDTIYNSRLQITKDERSRWEIKTIANNQSEYLLEGTTIDSTFTTGSYFGMLCKYTTVNSSRFVFDDITIESFAPSDIEPPRLTSVTVLDSTTLQVSFNESIDSISAKDLLSYSLNNSYGNPINISSTDSRVIFHLKFNKSFLSGNYIFSVTGIKDLYGNLVAKNTMFSFSYRKPYLATKRDLIINEIFGDPTPQIDLPSVEFIEIMNTAREPINLRDWAFSDAVINSKLPDAHINPGEYIILCAKSDTNEFKLYGRTLGISPWPTLNNSGDVLKIISPEGTAIDSVSYSDSWYQNSLKKQGGWSLERVDPESACEGIFNWAASQDQAGGTPGKANSVYYKDFDQLELKADSVVQISDTTVSVFFNKPLSGTVQPDHFSIAPAISLKTITLSTDWKKVSLVYTTPLKSNTTYEVTIDGIYDCAGNRFSTGSGPLIFRTNPGQVIPPPVRVDTSTIFITELFADPSPEVGLPLVEFVEIYNPNQDTISLDGWALADLVTNGAIKDEEILPKQYLILCPLADTAAYKPFGKVVGVSPWPALNNASDQITLRSHAKRSVDSVAYYDTWYQDRTKKQGGWTLERIFNDNICQGFYNWKSSNANIGGTPGKVNSVIEYTHALRITGVTILSDSTINVLLNAIPDTSNFDVSFFNLNQGIGNAEEVTFGIEDPSILKLTFNTKFTEGAEYILTVNSLRSCSGSLIDDAFNSYLFKIPETPHFQYPIVINEIFADPSPVIGIPEAEFIELYNPSEEDVELKGLIYEDSSKARYQFTTGEIEANGYLILCAQKDTLSYKPFGKVVGINPWPVLNNDKDVLILKDNKGYELHRVSYTNNWYKDKEKQLGGYSLEMIDPSSVCSGIQNWTSSKDRSGGTPGKENSVLSIGNSAHPLALLNATLTDSLTITLIFNKSIDSLSASNTNNYSINNGLNTPISALPISPDFDKIALKFPSPISRGKNYQLTVSNIMDCTGTLISSSQNTAEFMYAERIEKGDIVINEILFNPRPNGVDFVEIYNNSSKIVDLNELSLATTDEKDSLIQDRKICNTSFLFTPMQYMVLTSNTENIKAEYLTEAPHAFMKLSSLPSFNDDSGVAVLTNGGLRIDQLNYSEKMHIPLIKDPEGVSLERTSNKTGTNAIGNFRSAAASVGYATPGYKNSQIVEELASEEAVKLSSKTFSPDNDGFEDALLLNYHFKEPGMIANVSIYNDQGALIKKLTRNHSLAAEGILYWDGMNELNEKAPVGIYLMYMEVFDLEGRVKKYRKNFVLACKL